jgi:uncharacterized surface protein with fasciclin (FAS1) repeats
MQLFGKISFILLAGLALTACDSNDITAPEPVQAPLPPAETILDVATEAGDFATLLTAIDTAGLTSTIDDEAATLTVFAPTDAAFALLGDEAIDALLADPDTLSDILLYHVVSGAEIDSTAAKDAVGTTVEMANGDLVGISAKKDALFINLAKVTATDIQADNGVIHVIDAVLIPPTDATPSESNITNIAAADERFTTLVAALGATGLDTALASETDTFTVFAPTNDAFEAMGAENVTALLADLDNLTAILQQHVIADAAVDAVTAYSLSGNAATTVGGAEVPVSITSKRALRVGGAKVVTADIYASNGIIHVIDTVIVGATGLPKPSLNIAEIATAAGGFDTLLTALATTDLVSVLADSEQTYTVFAPTDEAFAQLGSETINALLADSDLLTDILLYHVYPGAAVLADAAISVAASDDSILEMANASAVENGDRAALSLGTAGLTVNLASVTKANVMASNGVIHVIDNVMLPPASKGDVTANIVETAVAAGSFTALVSALEAADLVDALSDPDSELTVFAPTDAAFEAIDPDALSALLADTEALTSLLTSHVVAGASVDSVTAYSLNGTSVETLSGKAVSIGIENGKLLIDGAAVVSSDIYTTNGIIHVIDQVIAANNSE